LTSHTIYDSKQLKAIEAEAKEADKALNKILKQLGVDA